MHVQGMCGLACHRDIKCQPPRKQHSIHASGPQGTQAHACSLSVNQPTARLALAMPIQCVGPVRLQFLLLRSMAELVQAAARLTIVSCVCDARTVRLHAQQQGKEALLSESNHQDSSSLKQWKHIMVPVTCQVDVDIGRFAVQPWQHQRLLHVVGGG